MQGGITNNKSFIFPKNSLCLSVYLQRTTMCDFRVLSKLVFKNSTVKHRVTKNQRRHGLTTW